MASLSDAPWSRNRGNIDMRLRALERRVSKIEAILTRSTSTSASDDPRPPLMPPDGAVPRALQRIFDLRVEAHKTSKQVTMLYDFLILKHPGAIEDLERILRVDGFSPTASDDLYPEDTTDLQEASGMPPHDVDLLVADTGVNRPAGAAENPDAGAFEEVAEETELSGAENFATGEPNFPPVTPATPAPKRRRHE